MKRNGYILLYAVILGTICSVLPTAVSEMTTPYRQANIQAEEIRTILQVLQLPFDAHAPAKRLVENFTLTVRKTNDGGHEKFIPIQPQNGAAMAVKFSGQGIWGPIKGVVALRADGRTIHGISFYHNEETPGLGGEIGAEEFCDKFKGKSIIDSAGKPAFRIVRTGAARSNEIDGISGATLTCNKVSAILNGLFADIYKEQKRG